MIGLYVQMPSYLLQMLFEIISYEVTVEVLVSGVRGVHPLWDHDAFPPCFRFTPLFSKNFQTLKKIFTIFTILPKNLFIFIRRNFWWPFFSDRSTKNFEFPPFFLFQNISPLFRENYYFPPIFDKFPPCFTQIHLLFTYFACIFPPYFDHDAFMHHPMHVLDAPVRRTCSCQWTCLTCAHM